MYLDKANTCATIMLDFAIFPRLSWHDFPHT